MAKRANKYVHDCGVHVEEEGMPRNEGEQLALWQRKSPVMFAVFVR